MPSSSWILRAVFGPRPGYLHEPHQLAGEPLSQLHGLRDLAGLEQRLDLLLERLADVRQLGARPSAASWATDRGDSRTERAAWR